MLQAGLRSVLRTPAARQFTNARLIQLAPRPFTTSALRASTGGVSQQPGSKSFTELAKNAKEEASDIVAEMGETISASKGHEKASGLESVKHDLQSMSVIAEKIPQNALAAGAAGLIPYAVTSLTTIYLSRQAGISVATGEGSFDAETALALLHHVEQLQMQYGAIILSFLGAIHWGFEFAGYGGHHRNRYLLGIAPVLVGWGSLLLPGQIALATQWAGFTGMWWLDQKTTASGWAPRWYSTYRFWLTAVVGSSILLTLGAANYWGPGNRVSTTGERLKAVQKDSGDAKTMTTSEGMELSKGDDAFTKFTNVKKLKEEAARKAEEEKAAKEKEEQTEGEKRRKAALQK